MIVLTELSTDLLKSMYKDCKAFSVSIRPYMELASPSERDWSFLMDIEESIEQEIGKRNLE